MEQNGHKTISPEQAVEYIQTLQADLSAYRAALRLKELEIAGLKQQLAEALETGE